jgi:hypothetical protein
MARYLSTIPDNQGFFNLGTVWSYPTGGSGPTAYGSTGYFGSTPLPSTDGDSIATAIDLGDFSSPFRTITISNTHGGLSRKQTTFYKLRTNRPRSVQFTQNFSEFAYTQNTNRNTLLAFYRITDGTHRVEMPINDSGYVYKSSAVDYDTDENVTNTGDYPNNIRLDPGEYMFLVTNDIRYQETTYSISINVATLDWRFVNEDIEELLDFGSVLESTDSVVDFGSLAA